MVILGTAGEADEAWQRDARKLARLWMELPR
jgi:hypothetical protein